MENINDVVKVSMIELDKTSEGEKLLASINAVLSFMGTPEFSIRVNELRSEIQDRLTDCTFDRVVREREAWDVDDQLDREYVANSLAYNILQYLTLPEVNPIAFNETRLLVCLKEALSFSREMHTKGRNRLRLAS